MKEHKGLPENYAGAYEQWAKNSCKTVPKPTISQTMGKDAMEAREVTKPDAAPAAPFHEARPEPAAVWPH